VKFPSLTATTKGARLSVCEALVWLCALVEVHPSLGSQVMPVVAAPLAQTCLSRRPGLGESTRLSHPVTGRPVARHVFEMVPLLLYLCRRPPQGVLATVQAARRQARLSAFVREQNVEGCATGSSTAELSRDFDPDLELLEARSILLNEILGIVLSVLQRVDLSLQATHGGPEALNDPVGESAVLTATMTGYAEGGSLPG